MTMMVTMTRHHPSQPTAALPWPRVRQRKQISFRERMWIRSLLDDGDSLRSIAAKTGRNVSVISREVCRNTRRSGVYDPLYADYTAEHRRKRPQQRKAARSPRLLARIAFDLSRGVGPKRLADRLKQEARGSIRGMEMDISPADHEHPAHTDPRFPAGEFAPGTGGETISHEAIYQYIYATPIATLKAHGIRLPHKRYRRRPAGKRHSRRTPIVGMRQIHTRPAEVAGRAVPGHWEGDLIIGKNGKTAVATLAERTSRFTIMKALPLGKESDGVADVLIDTVNGLGSGLNGALFKTLTWDRGTEMAQHARLNQESGLDVFFADAYSPGQRGTNESINREARKFWDKGTALPTDQEEVDRVAAMINNIPRGVLGSYTPYEKFMELLAADTVAPTP